VNRVSGGHIPSAFRRRAEAAPLSLELIASELGITIDEAAESVERLIAAGWLTPTSRGTLALTRPHGER
jgi:hypothetical protein